MSFLQMWPSSPRLHEQHERVILICAPIVATSMILYAQSAYLHGAWQLFAVIGVAALALAGVSLSFLLSRRRPAAAFSILLTSMLLWAGLLPIFLYGVAQAAALAAALVVAIVGAGTMPERWRIWLGLSVAAMLLIVVVDRYAPFQRYDPGPFSLPSLYLLSINAIGLGVIFWRIAVVVLRPSGSIRTRLLLTTVLLILFTGAAITYFNQIVIVRLEQRDAISRMSEIASRTELATGTWADSLQSSLSLFIRHTRPQLDVLLADGPRNRDAYLIALNHAFEDLHETTSQSQIFKDMAIIDPSGGVLVSTKQQFTNWAPLMATCLSPTQDGPCLQPPSYNQTVGSAIMVVVDPILGDDGRIMGYVAGYAGLDKLLGQVDSLSMDETLVVSLFDPDYRILTAIPAERIGSVAFDPRLAMGAGEGGQTSHLLRAFMAGFYKDVRGVSVVGVYRWLPSLHSFLLIEQAQSAAFRPELLTLDIHLGVTLLLLALGVLIAMAVVRSITAPLKHLSTVAMQIGDGALDVTASITRDDEIGALARVFNQMTERLRRARDELEQRVQQRTEELAHANANLLTENAERRQAEQTVQYERNKLKGILDAMDDGVYIVNRQFEIEYINPALEREFGQVNGQLCYTYLYHRDRVCTDCPNDLVWQGQPVRREERLGNGKIYDIFDTPLADADGRLGKLAIFHDVTARREAEDMIRLRNNELAVLSRRLVEIQESERQYIARELHDETGQLLTSLMLRLGMLERELSGDPRAADGMAEIKQTVMEVFESLHGLAANLRPTSLDHVGLMSALRQHIERMADRHKIVIDFEAIGFDERRLQAEVEITVYRIVQEALVNVIRHANATQVDVIIERRPGQLRVVIEDNGQGFDVQQGMFTGRLGLIGMRERAEMIGGTLLVDSAPAGGTMILMEAPCDDTDPDRR